MLYWASSRSLIEKRHTPALTFDTVASRVNWPISSLEMVMWIWSIAVKLEFSIAISTPLSCSREARNL